MTKKTDTHYYLGVQVQASAVQFLDICGHLLVDETGEERQFDDRVMDDHFALEKCKGTDELLNYKIHIDAVNPWPWIRVQLSATCRHTLFSVDMKELDKLGWRKGMMTGWKRADILSVYGALFVDIVAVERYPDDV